MENLQPRIRFIGFTDAWEQRRLGDLCQIAGGGTPNTNISEYWGGNIPWVTPAELNDKIYLYSSAKTITEMGLNNSSAKLLPIGTVLFTSRAGIGKSAILKVEAATNQGFQSIIPNENKLDSYFIFSNSWQIKNYAERVGAGSTFVEVSPTSMRKMNINIPNLQEQQSIGALFATLDKQITFQQRKLELLQELKKSLLNAIFI